MDGMIQVRVEADSVNPYTGKRLTTFVATYPRFIHSEVLTHRLMARNSSSSRAIPVATLIKKVEDSPVIPVSWGKNQKGMQADEDVDLPTAQEAQDIWLEAMESAASYARKLADLGIHKQITNRVIEPWMTITTVISGTEWDNFFTLRCDPTAQPEFQALACMMRDEMNDSEPVMRLCHIPFVTDEELIAWFKLSLNPWEASLYSMKVATGRLARVSYLTHEGIRDPDKDIDLFGRLRNDKHMSPFEHCAVALPALTPNRGCFSDWRQFRQEVEDGRIGLLEAIAS